MSKVLVVDDSPMVREMITTLLKKYGLAVAEASNGSEAKDKFEEVQPDLVISDIVMPEMNGYEFCRWIKNDASRKDVPVVLCTSKAEEFDRYWGMKQGADAYIAKPFQPKELIETVKQLLQ